MLRVDFDTATVRVYPRRIPHFAALSEKTWKAMRVKLEDDATILAETLTRETSAVWTVEIVD